MGWNPRGFGRRGRRSQLKEYIRKEKLDIIFLQETMRQDFTDQELRGLVNGESFHWHWRAANGRSGGMLLGVRDETLEVGAIDQGQPPFHGRSLGEALSVGFFTTPRRRAAGVSGGSSTSVAPLDRGNGGLHRAERVTDHGGTAGLRCTSSSSWDRREYDYANNEIRSHNAFRS